MSAYPEPRGTWVVVIREIAGNEDELLGPFRSEEKAKAVAQLLRGRLVDVLRMRNEPDYDDDDPASISREMCPPEVNRDLYDGGHPDPWKVARETLEGRPVDVPPVLPEETR